MQDYVDPAPGTTWPPVHGIYPRIFAELGLIGLLLWLSLWMILTVKCYIRYAENSRQLRKPDYYGLALILSIVGVLMCGLNTDTFRFMGYWITLALGLIYMQKRTVREVKILGDNGNIK